MDCNKGCQKNNMTTFFSLLGIYTFIEVSNNQHSGINIMSSSIKLVESKGGATIGAGKMYPPLSNCRGGGVRGRQLKIWTQNFQTVGGRGVRIVDKYWCISFVIIHKIHNMIDFSS